MTQRYEHAEARSYWEVKDMEKDGWELVSAIQIGVDSLEARAGREIAGQMRFYLKRPAQ